ncbi:hypothetical protein AB0N06_33240 [Streptomyces sp. NPDC051020]|uniref:hypothetical protein n=1 Tax=Streptomyces sp. NPDC051020 TaxID=3155409 RepID=UPI0034142C60
MLTLTINGTEPVSATAVKAVTAVCDQAEDRPGPGIVTVEVSGAPAAGWTGGLGISLLTKWERALRRLERLPVATAAVATGDLGGTALEAFLARTSASPPPAPGCSSRSTARPPGPGWPCTGWSSRPEPHACGGRCC